MWGQGRDLRQGGPLRPHHLHAAQAVVSVRSGAQSDLWRLLINSIMFRKPAIVYGEIVLPAFIYYFGKNSKIVAALLVR